MTYADKYQSWKFKTRLYPERISSGRRHMPFRLRVQRQVLRKEDRASPPICEGSIQEKLRAVKIRPGYILERSRGVNYDVSIFSFPCYLRKMIEIADRNRHCEILCFTKKYDIVNRCLDSGVFTPPNLHLVFSAWRNLRMENPYHLPVAHVRYRDGTTTASAAAIQCRGNCTECATTDGGCWSLQNGQEVVFDEH